MGCVQFGNSPASPVYGAKQSDDVFHVNDNLQQLIRKSVIFLVIPFYFTCYARLMLFAILLASLQHAHRVYILHGQNSVHPH